MKISVFLHHILAAAEQENCPWESLLPQIREAGITGLEVSREEMEGRMEQIREAGLRVSSMYCTHAWEKGTGYETGRQHADSALACGADSILVIPGFLSEEEGRTIRALADDPEKLTAYLDGCQPLQNIAEGLRQTVAYAREISGGRLAVTLEDYDYFTSPCATLGGLLYLTERIPGLKFTLDCGNFAYSDQDVLQAYEKLRDRIVHVHCKDRGEEPAVLAQGMAFNRGLAETPAGGGYIPLGEIIPSLLAGGYLGWLAIEHFGAEDYLKDMLASAGYLRGLAAKG